LIISYLVNPNLRRFPKGLILMTAVAANILVGVVQSYSPNRLLRPFLVLFKAGGMVLPTFAGHDEIWCGGNGVTVYTPYSFTYTNHGVFITLSYSITQLTVFSSACSFQGICYNLPSPPPK